MHIYCINDINVNGASIGENIYKVYFYITRFFIVLIDNILIL